MMIGASIERDKKNKNNRICSFVSTLDQKFSRYYSQYTIQEEGMALNS